MGEFFPHIFHVFFAQFFTLPDLPVLFFKYVNVDKPMFFASGEFHE